MSVARVEKARTQTGIDHLLVWYTDEGLMDSSFSYQLQPQLHVIGSLDEKLGIRHSGSLKSYHISLPLYS
jgi:hypothetical protein